MEIKKMLGLVAEFQNASKQPVREKPSIGKDFENILRFELMKEENKEYLDACNEDDKVEILDAVVDKMYILLGTINQHGMQGVFEEAFKRVHDNNMTKVVDGEVKRNDAGKILKPKGYVNVDISDLV